MIRPAGVPPDALPPDFDGWDKAPSVPDHPLGSIAAIDYDTGLPIVKRRGAEASAVPAPKPEPEQEPEPAAETKPASEPEKPAEPKPEPKETPFAKGSKVSLRNGTRASVLYSHPQMKLARIKTEDGKTMTMNHKDLTPLIEVKAHARAHPAGHGKVQVAAHVRGVGPIEEQT